MFCTKCGAQVTEGSRKFCTSCGAPLSASSSTTGPTAQASGPSAQPSSQLASSATAPSAPAAGAKPSSPWAKVLIAVLGIFVFLSIAVMGTCAYVGYRMKKKVEEAKAEYGLDKIGKMPGSSSSSPVPEREVCSLLSKEEVSEITGVTITETHGSTSECTYASATNPMVFQDNVTWQGGAMAYKMSVATVKFNAPGGQAIVKLSGIGDEGWTIGMQGKMKEEFDRDAKNDASGMLKNMMGVLGQAPLMFRKGDVMVSLGVSEARDADEAKKALATKIASRI